MLHVLQLKSLKEQLESKDLHLEMMRKKVSALEDGLANRSGLEREKDDEFVRNRKLTKLVERYKRELSDMHATVRELKARLLESSEIKVRWADGRWSHWAVGYSQLV